MAKDNDNQMSVHFTDDDFPLVVSEPVNYLGIGDLLGWLA